MTLQDIEQQVYKLSIAERLSLLNIIIQSLQQEIEPPSKLSQQEKLAVVKQMRGFLARPEESAPANAN